VNAVRASSNSISGSSAGGWPQNVLPTSQAVPESCIRAGPDFAEVYKFIGSVFDPGVSGHLRKLKEMSPIDRETVLLLMRNLSINLSSPGFDEHKLFLSVYDKTGLEGKATGLEEFASTPGTCPQPCSDTGDDATSVSGQAGTPPPTPHLVSPRSVDSGHSQQRTSILQGYADSATDAQTPRRQPYDGGGAISSSFISGASPTSPGVLESVSMANPPPIVLPASSTLQPPLTDSDNVYAITSLPSLPSLGLSSLPSLPAGLVGDPSGVEAWWP